MSAPTIPLAVIVRAQAVLYRVWNRSGPGDLPSVPYDVAFEALEAAAAIKAYLDPLACPVELTGSAQPQPEQVPA